MNLPNKLTMMRVIMVPFFMVFAAMSHMGTLRFNATYALIAGILFAVASFTDFLDGYLARKNHLVTDFGKFMDPLADKMLTTAAIMAIGIYIPFSPLGAMVGLEPLPLSYFPWLVATLLSYCLVAQGMKRFYIKRFGQWF